MTRTISIITATVGAALLFVVPAWADNWGADKAQPLTQPDPMIEDGFAQAVAAAERIRIERMLDARERGLGVANTPVDARSDGMNRIHGLGEYAPPVVADDRFRIDHSSVPEPVSATSSGRDFEWPTVGIGFGVGLVLLLGLGLTLKATHTRPFAH